MSEPQPDALAISPYLPHVILLYYEFYSFCKYSKIFFAIAFVLLEPILAGICSKSSILEFANGYPLSFAFKSISKSL